MKLTIISPHLDDAVLSVGAAIAHHRTIGDDVTVITCCSIAADERRVDADKRALAHLDARAIHLGGKDAPLRGYALSWASLCQGDDDVDHTNALERALRSLARIAFDDAVVWAPLAVGGHVDHRAARDATLRIVPFAHLYEDRPYARQRSVNEHDFDDEVVFLRSVCAPTLSLTPPPNYQRRSITVTPTTRAQRAQAMAEYHQLDATLFDADPRRWPNADVAEYLWSPV